MTSSSIFKDYLGVRTAAARPATPTLAPGCLGVYYATDTTTWSIWTGSAWISPPSLTGTAGGDLSGTFPNPVVAKINQVALGSTTANAGNLLISGASSWVSQAVSGDITINSTGTTAIGANKVTNTMLAQAGAYTLVGNNGSATANVADLTQAQVAAMIPMRSYLSGLTLSNDAGTPNTVLDIAAGICTDSTNAFPISIGAFTKKTDGSWTAGINANGMGTGLTIANSTWYHVFAIINAGAADVYFDTSITAANKPASTTAFRRIGSFVTDGSAHIRAFTQNGDEFLWLVPLLDYSTTSLSATPSTPTLPSVPLGVKVTAILFGVISHASLSTSVLINSIDQTSVAGGDIVYNMNALTNSGGGANTLGSLAIRTDASQTIRVVSSISSTSLRIMTNGYIDRRGRDG